MARNRMIKKEFWTSEQIMNLPIGARLLFIGMWNQADDEGILKNSPMQLKAQIFPCDMEIDLAKIKYYIDLIKAENLIIYNQKTEAEDQNLIKIKKWCDHQKISKPTPSKYNFIEEDQEHSRRTPGVVKEDSSPKESKVIENKVKESKVKKTKTNKSGMSDIFLKWWKTYNKDSYREKAWNKWKALKESDHEIVLNHTKRFVLVTEKQFRPDGFRYLANKTYLNEIIDTGPDKTTDLKAEEKHKRILERQREEERKAREAYEADPVGEDESIADLIGLPKKSNIAVAPEDSPKSSKKIASLTSLHKEDKSSSKGSFKSLGSIIGNE
tara:strand:+ start:1836 stop:2813 length:978 start_codon:yes stop_codon:yes gene_type:complete